ncbi:hypothetical protein [Hymenobacter lucidus]|uniref:VCBS repeat-containing protein n=1 Tax=Hymenobacter lucidus TaxID=2880930 RepID=A0ABS8AU17_9BACT|nr:hypothetical protein [Hymenobacter lucidus]MCB2409234.1 hypothetical protein [Hymenobacter lucidus]
MKALVVTLLASLAVCPAVAQTRAVPKVATQGRALRAFIPAGYDTLPGGRALGDLNHDGRPDVALVLRPQAETQDGYDGETMPGRILLVLFGAAPGYTLAERAGRVMITKDGGGQYGDPFAGLTISKGVLTVHHYGGSSWRWSVVSKFRYQQGHFYLIGETTILSRTSGDCESVDGSPGGELHDTNFLTGEYEIRKISEACRVLLHRKGRHPPVALRRLADYTPAP